ncbi:hypothetical protein GIB67_027446 [Kingdonia uniflora]|uniref:Uncharacterized protein n=1 Tax=Kingdonia uniflora TaxID=39325 RepID=A0A7J7MF78_9MAGN|nr:hypothetical protein GIB67_027446 [Kingdonia uniflora]
MKEKEEELALFLEMQKRGKDRNSLINSSSEIDSSLGSKPGSYPISKNASSPPARKARSYDLLNYNSDKNDYDWLITPPQTPLFPALETKSEKTAISPAVTPKARPTILMSRLENKTELASRGNIVSKKPILTSGLNSSKFSRSSTPTSRSTLPSSRPTAPRTKSSTPVMRSSTPTFRPTFPTSKTLSRSTTPTARHSSVTMLGPTTAKRPVPSRGSSPTVRSHPWKPSEMPGFSLNAPPNLRTLVFDRSVSASRGRQGVSSADGKPTRQSCSPSRARAPNAVKREHSNNRDSVSPVLVGTKMVERVINMRKLAPPNQDRKHNQNNSSRKMSSSLGSSEFGRTISRASLDMALRHMDIRGIKGNLRPLTTNIPASSVYTVRSGPTRSGTISVSDSPLATSSNASSEMSVNNNIFCFDGSEVDDDRGSETGVQSLH